MAGAIAGVITGLGIILWMSISSILPSASAEGPRFHIYLTIVFGTSAILLVGFLFTLFGKKGNRGTGSRDPRVP